jgi:HlyD family secretion protein
VKFGVYKRGFQVKKLIFGAVALLLLAVAGIVFYLKRSPEPQFRTAKVETGTILSTVTATGTLNAVVTVQVGTQVSGTIQKLYVDFNSIVKKGQAIAQIDPAIFNAQVEQSRGNYLNAQANVSKAKADVVDTRRTLARNTQLLKDGVISQADFDTAETKYQQALDSVKAAEGSVAQTFGAYRQAQTNLRYSTIKSPVDGIVVSRNVDVGQTVAASFQTPTLFTIAQDLTKMQIDTSVDEADIGKIRVGENAEFNVDAYPELHFTGKVVQIRNAPTIAQNVVTYNVIIAVDNKELKLKPGMTANVNIEVLKKDDVLKVPGAALRFRPTAAREETARPTSANRHRGVVRPAGRQVYVLKEGKPVPVSVTTGISDNSFVEITGGKLRPGEEVITSQILPGKKSATGVRPMGPRF